MKSFAFVAGFCVLLFALTFIYLYPGSQALFEGRTDAVMSDGSDPASLPYAYDLLIQTWQKHPSRLFYGSVYIDTVDPEKGTPAWHPWDERWLVVLNSYLFPVEQLTSAVVFWLFLLNGLSMLALCAYCGWPRSVSVALAFAWTFSCYERARAKVHMALVGTYHLPLIFLGLLLVTRGKSWRSFVAATFAFLVAGTVVHHYLITCVFISPVFLIFVFLQPEFRADPKRVALRLAGAVLPLLMFLAWNFLVPLPSDAKMTAGESMQQGQTAEQELATNKIFLRTYYAWATDYLAGDVALRRNGAEWNPLRAEFNAHVWSTLGLGNAHERSNGIRWSVLLLALMAIVMAVVRRDDFESSARRNLWYFAGFALFMFWMSLSPDVPFDDLGASNWIFTIFPKIRVASRAGINVHFALLMILGIFVTSAPIDRRWRKVLVYPGVLVALMIADYPPLQEMPMASIAPVYSALQRSQGACGLGMAFPFFNSYIGMNINYNFVQRMRGSDCAILNAAMNIPRIVWMARRFPATDEFLRQLKGSPQIADELIRVARCVPLNWIVFHAATPADWSHEVCQRLGWTYYADGECIAPEKNQPVKVYPENCGG